MARLWKPMCPRVLLQTAAGAIIPGVRLPGTARLHVPLLVNQQRKCQILGWPLQRQSRYRKQRRPNGKIPPTAFKYIAFLSFPFAQ